MSINLILAVGRNGEVGQSNTPNGLPWHNPEDMVFFKRKTEGNVVVMGRKTFDALPFENGLPDRHNYIMSSSIPELSKVGFRDLYVNHNMNHTCRIGNEAWIVSKLQLHRLFGKEVYIIGGVSIYNQLNKYADTAYITRIDRECPDADAHIDLSWLDKFELVDRETLNDYSYVETYKRKR